MADIPQVAAILGDKKIVINKGANDGVRLGQRFLVYGIGDEIFDPHDGKSLGRIELVRGEGRVVHVQEKMSTLESSITKKIPETRVIKKSAINSYLFGGDQVEEYSPERTLQLPFDGVESGDFARPV